MSHIPFSFLLLYGDICQAESSHTSQRATKYKPKTGFCPIIGECDIPVSDSRIDLAGRITMKNSRDSDSYPDDYHVHVSTSKGIDIFIRPLLQSDRELLKAFLHSLSFRSVYYRFLSPLREFNEELLNRLMEVDHRKHIALAAFPREESPEILFGVTRLFIEEDLSSAEFSVVVLDRLQGKGIGAELFGRCIEIGRSLRVCRIWGLVLSENTQMLKLARKLDFEVRREPGSSEYFVSHDYR